jgi:ABC-type Fe3+/spermidine/putrescine transport system ATPase subunit
VAGARIAKLANGAEVGIPEGHPPNGAVTLALRPERLALHRDGESVPDGRNRLRARITRRTYYGDVFYYDVDAGLGEVLEVKEENRPEIGTHDVGDEVTVSWSVNAANLVSD